MTNRPIIFGMVTTSRSHSYTEIALESFARWTNLRNEDTFCLIDNDSDFEFSPALHSSPARSAFAERIELLKNSAPKGFSANANQLIARALATSSDLIFMNNDLVFTREWLTPLLMGEHAIVSPLCNRDVQYAISTVIPKNSHVSHVFALSGIMELKDYVGNEACFEAIAECHRRGVTGYAPVLNVPFFCIRLPFAVLERVGKFDEEYGNGGGEDYDYGLRAYLAGSEIQIALGSFILHFQGRSSWAGGETKEEQRLREERFFNHFISKWGRDLFDLILRENVKILDKTPQFNPERPADSFRSSIHALKGELAPAIRL